MSEKLSGHAIMEANAAATIEHLQLEKARRLNDVANSELRNIYLNSPDVATLNDAAEIAVFGTGGLVEGYVDEDGNPLASPINGKINDILENRRYGKLPEERQAKAEDYKQGILGLVDEGFELFQAKAIMDERETQAEDYSRLVAKVTAQNMRMGDEPLEAHSKAQEWLGKRFDQMRYDNLKGVLTPEDLQRLQELDSAAARAQEPEANETEPVVAEPVVNEPVEPESETEQPDADKAEAEPKPLKGTPVYYKPAEEQQFVQLAEEFQNPENDSWMEHVLAQTEDRQILINDNYFVKGDQIVNLDGLVATLEGKAQEGDFFWQLDGDSLQKALKALNVNHIQKVILKNGSVSNERIEDITASHEERDGDLFAAANTLLDSYLSRAKSRETPQDGSSEEEVVDAEIVGPAEPSSDEEAPENSTELTKDSWRLRVRRLMDEAHNKLMKNSVSARKRLSQLILAGSVKVDYGIAKLLGKPAEWKFLSDEQLGARRRKVVGAVAGALALAGVGVAAYSEFKGGNGVSHHMANATHHHALSPQIAKYKEFETTLPPASEAGPLHTLILHAVHKTHSIANQAQAGSHTVANGHELGQPAVHTQFQ